ncbi:Sir2 family NAD-dependent protein deacetylase [Massilia sp. ST3]|uniref:SIR2 family NAD-dependent protein deacylase n=1 Tax=Massilia sp. ST3 TaxID=2824903 RepID=UPI001B827512|nr:Sir2 family NAD-dependent protein deacetylase [Massilia sp. ST3]MBQ5949950.1 NAD-dependent deacetylase [Massilia sp. ST3]
MPSNSPPLDGIERAAALLKEADGLLIAAGAGIGVDSGLPDFRGTSGFWRAYPALARRRLPFHEVACPDTFASDPRLAWGFYGHRLDLYRRTRPHGGFAILHAFGERMAHGSFVFTSNVDGQFQQAGFAEDRIAECHGSIHHLQCTRPCCGATWPADGFVPEVDAAQCLLTSALPLCPRCGALARPNILMFGDGAWIGARTEQQYRRLDAWRSRVGRLAVIELGAGTAIPSVRRCAETQGVPVIRVNPREAEVADGVSLAMGALAAMQALAQATDLI